MVEKKAEELYPIGEDLKNNVWGREEKKGNSKGNHPSIWATPRKVV
jgi:hypothetical protein